MYVYIYVCVCVSMYVCMYVCIAYVNIYVCIYIYMYVYMKLLTRKCHANVQEIGTPLIKACLSGNLEHVKILIDAGADIEITNQVSLPEET